MDKNSVKAGLRKLDLKRYYDAVNDRYFEGRLSKNVIVVWKTQKQVARMRGGSRHVYGFAGFVKGFKLRIVLNIDVHVDNPRQLLNTMVHEAIHILMPFGDVLNRKSSYANTTNAEHGEFFGAEARRINALVGHKLMSDRECSYGMGGHKWTRDNVFVECGEYPMEGIRGMEKTPKCTFRGTKRQMQKHKAEHRRQWDAWYEQFGEANEKWEAFKSEHWNDQIPTSHSDYRLSTDDELWERYQIMSKSEKPLRLQEKNK